MGNCCYRVTPEHQVATPSSTDVQKSPNSLTKVDPGKDRCVTPEHQVATPSSTDVQKSPNSLTKVDPGKDRCVPEYNLLEKNHQQQHMVASEKAEIPQVQADTSGHVPSTEREGTVEMH
ncbi:uncharacterized protein LOC143270582 isoform X2 [Peromyscus maniculatus bairdii]|uniref:uncharacterized protein LOC143270582 isoform X2 n=1 Tax=Peromyscus maniculatus bairdii TaxID=230844 RepID=UPI003FD381D2